MDAMNAVLDEELIYRTRRRVRKLSPEDRIAINLFKRKDVPVTVIARVFKVSKNTVYYKALGHSAPSYPASDLSAAAEADAIIDKLGFDAAWAKYVTDEQVEAINRENAIEANRRDEARMARQAAA